MTSTSCVTRAFGSVIGLLEIMTPDRIDVDILPGFVSLRYTDMFDTVGDFELWCNITKRNREMLQEFNLVNFDNGLAGEIGYTEKSRELQKATLLHIKGNMITRLLDTKIVWGLFTDYNKPEDIMASLVQTQCISPLDTTRTIQGLEMGEKAVSGYPKIDYQNTGGEIVDSLTKLAQPYGLGYEINFDYAPAVPTMKFNILKGIDRSIAQSTNNEIVFSVSNGNISGSKYIRNAMNVKNTALVAGEGEGNDRTYVVVSAFPNLSGTARRELFVDARDLQKRDENGNVISNATYLLMLQERGIEKLKQYTPLQTFSVELAGSNLYTPGVHFFKGDIVTVRDEEIGAEANVQIKGLEYTYDENGTKKTSVILGDLQPRIIDIVRRREHI